MIALLREPRAKHRQNRIPHTPFPLQSFPRSSRTRGRECNETEVLQDRPTLHKLSGEVGGSKFRPLQTSEQRLRLRYVFFCLLLAI